MSYGSVPSAATAGAWCETGVWSNYRGPMSRAHNTTERKEPYCCSQQQRTAVRSNNVLLYAAAPQTEPGGITPVANGRPAGTADRWVCTREPTEAGLPHCSSKTQQY